MGEQDNLKCPCCEKDLRITHRGRYQDMGEHVCSPNSEPSLKDGYQCENRFCIANNFRATWIEDGSIFINDLPEQFAWTTAHRVIERNSVSGMYWALNSWNHYYQSGQNKMKRMKIKIKLGLYALEFEPKEKGYMYGITKRYEPSLFRWRCRIWKKQGDSSYSLLTPFWKMANHVIRKFHRNYKSWVNDYSKRDLEECFYAATSMTSYGASDTRFFSKFSSLYLQIFYPNKVKKVIFDYRNYAHYKLVTDHLGIQYVEYIYPEI